MKALHVCFPASFTLQTPQQRWLWPGRSCSAPTGLHRATCQCWGLPPGASSRESFDFKASAQLMITRDAPKCAGNTHIRKRCLGTTSMVTSHCLLVLPEAGPGQGRAWEYGQCAQAGAVPWRQHSPHAADGSSRGGGGGGPLPTSPWLLALRPQDAFEGWAHGSGEGLRPRLGHRQRFPPTPAPGTPGQE